MSITPDRRRDVNPTIAPLQRVDVAAEVAVVGSYFAGDAALRSAAAIEELLPVADLLVCDELDFGAMAMAQRAGVPVVVVSVIASGALVRPEGLTAAFNRLSKILGMQEPVRPRGDCFVVPFHPAMRDPRFTAPKDTQWMRPGSAMQSQPDGSVVATLGTEFNTESGDLFPRILDALAQVGAPARVAVGRDLDPNRFGPQPTRVRVEPYIDFEVALPRASVVLHHGGSSLLTQSVLAGVPQIVLPMGADQPFNAETVARLGLGITLDPFAATAATIAAAIEHLAADKGARRRVSSLRSLVLGLLEPSQVVAHIETLNR